MVVVDPIGVGDWLRLIPMIEEDSQDNLLRRITGIRRQLMAELGLILPVVRIRDNLRLPPQAYRIKIRGQEVATSEILLDRSLAIPGSDVEEPINGIQTNRTRLRAAGFVDHRGRTGPGGIDADTRWSTRCPCCAPT